MLILQLTFKMASHIKSGLRSVKSVKLGSASQTNAYHTNRKMEDDGKIIPVHRMALRYPNRIAIKDSYGFHSYKDVLLKAIKLSKLIQKSVGLDKSQERIGFLCPNDVSYVVCQFACWATGHIAVPLSPLHPPSLLAYYVQDCEASLIIAAKNFSKVLSDVKSNVTRPISTIILEEDSWHKTSTFVVDGNQHVADDEKTADPELEALFQETKPTEFYESADALILYTSGTTGKPKGVLLSHLNLDTQVRMLLKTWGWTKKDVIVHSLPLHHTHGVVNALLCPLHVGARCIMLPKFDAAAIWNNFLGVDMINEAKPTIFMGVPTMYAKLLSHYENSFKDSTRMMDYIKSMCSNNIRVMISGSAALPEPVFYKWKAATGIEIVERYGMTEIGSVLSIPLDGERRAGYVGVPSPGVSIRLAEFTPSPQGSKANYKVMFETNHGDILQESPQTKEKNSVFTGDLLIKGSNVFKCYWNKPEATAKDFTFDGWFRTGDAAQWDNGYFKILGRLSADIIKSGGYKISALQIETELLGHPEITDCTVVGIPDVTWGQKVAAALVLRNPNQQINFQDLKLWCKSRMASYMVPSEWRIYSELPRNALGKVNKVEFAKTAFLPSSSLSKL